jgi:hypothetical protein
MSEWISVKDRLPEDGVHVITLYTGVVQHHTYALAEGKWFPDCMDGIEADQHDFTHWQPLPEPPK